MALRLTGGDDRSLGLACGQAQLLRYVFRPPSQAESPRPFFHPLRTRGGALVSGYRPADHPWHKGLSWALPNVGDGELLGRAHLPARERLPAVGQQRDGPARPVRRQAGVHDGELALDEQLTWLTGQGQAWFAERRRIRARLLAGYAAWALLFETTMLNVHHAALTIGSPGTEGRAGAGYGGLFWRGPGEFRGGAVIAPGGPRNTRPDGLAGPVAGLHRRGDPARPGRHPGVPRSPGNAGYPGAWFVRREPYACLCPAPFFDAERTVPPGEALTLRYQVAVADGGLSVAACADLVEQLAAWGSTSPPGAAPGERAVSGGGSGPVSGGGSGPSAAAGPGRSAAAGPGRSAVAGAGRSAAAGPGR